MKVHIDKYLQNQLDDRQSAGNLRELPLPFAEHPGKTDFLSNDYLGIARMLKNNPAQPDKSVLNGSTGSRLLSGNTREAQELEQFLAQFHQGESALLFNSGYDANLGLLSSIANRHTIYIYDAHCHASLIDGMRLSQAAHRFRFAHNDPASLEALLKKQRILHPDSPIMVILEAIYSMEGDEAPLESIAALCDTYSAALIVDEAHATGIYGTEGRGLTHQLGLTEKVFARIHTFGKALGTHGAAIIGSRLLYLYLLNYARSFIYTTALSPSSVIAISEAYTYLRAHKSQVQALRANISDFIQLRRNSGLNWIESSSPIQSLLCPDNRRCKKLAAYLKEQQFIVAPIMSPTVAAGSERIRFCLHSFNTASEIITLFKVLKEWEQKSL